MAFRIACALSCAAAPLLMLLSLPLFEHWWLVAGAIVCMAAFAAGYEAAFVTYAGAAWAFAAFALAGTDRLESSASQGFADAAYLMAALAIVVALTVRLVRGRRESQPM